MSFYFRWQFEHKRTIVSSLPTRCSAWTIAWPAPRFFFCAFHDVHAIAVNIFSKKSHLIPTLPLFFFCNLGDPLEIKFSYLVIITHMYVYVRGIYYIYSVCKFTCIYMYIYHITSYLCEHIYMYVIMRVKLKLHKYNSHNLYLRQDSHIPCRATHK